MIRSFQESDLPEIVEIANRAWIPIRKMSRRQLGNPLSDFFHPEGDAISKGIQIAHHLKDRPQDCLVCERNGRLAGFLIYHLNSDARIGEILNNAARPDSNEKGVGQEMYSAVLEFFRRKGLRCAMVTTGLDEAHEPARKAYERAGFRKNLSSVTFYMDLAEKDGMSPD